MSEYDGQTYRPKYHEDLVHSEITLPPNAPKEYADRATLWNAVELSEKGQKSQLARMLKASLPNEWSYELAEATLSYAEIKAVATGNPLIKEKMQIDNDVQRLKMLKATYDSQHYAMQDGFMVKFPKLIAAAEEKLKCVHEDVREHDKRLVAGAEFSIKVGGMTFTERGDGGTAFLSAASKCKTGTTTELAEYKGFTVLVEKNFMGTDYLVLRGKTEYKADMSTSPVGCMTKLENLFNGIQEKISFLEERLEKYRLDMGQAKADYEKPFQYGEELKTKLARQFELNNLLDMENRKSPKTAQSQEEEKMETHNPEEQVPHVAEPSYGYGTEREENR